MKWIGKRSAVLLAFAYADAEGETYIEKMERFIERLIEYDYRIVPIGTLVGRVPPDAWARSNVQKARRATRISNELSDSRCSECGQGWCVHLEQASKASEGWRRDE